MSSRRLQDVLKTNKCLLGTSLVKETDYNAKRSGVRGLVKETDYDAKISGTEEKHFTITDYNKFPSKILEAKIKKRIS